jgi:predicted transcriptional regulator of viral defense system
MVREKLVEFISSRNIVTMEEITGEINRIIGCDQENAYVYKKFIYPLLKKKYVRRIRQNLYHVTTPGKQNSIADRFLVASKIRDDYFISFHSALDFYGSAYSYRNRVLVGVKPQDRFDRFQYQNTVYAPYLTNEIKMGVVSQFYLGDQINVCSKERLLLECIKHPRLVGGWEEVLKSLQSLSGLDFDLLVNYLINLGNQSLLRRVGLVLELLRDESLFYQHLDDETLSIIQNLVKGNVRYLEKGISGELNNKWLLYVPNDFKEHLRGN